MSLLNLQSLGFLTKNKKLFLDFKKFRLTGQTSILLKISGSIQPPSLGIRCIFYDFDLYKTNINPTIYIKYQGRQFTQYQRDPIGCMIWLDKVFQRELLRYFPKPSANFQKKNAGNTFEDRSFSRKAPLDVSQSLYIEYLELISFFTIKYTNKATEAAP